MLSGLISTKKDGGLSSKTTTYAVSKKMALFLPGYCTARALCSVVVLCQNTIIFHWDILWISINICRLFTFSAMFVVFCFISGALWPDCWRFLVIKAGNQILFFYWSENSCWMQLFSYSGCNDVVKRHAFLSDLLTFIRLNYWLITLEFLIFSLKLKQCFFYITKQEKSLLILSDEQHE